MADSNRTGERLLDSIRKAKAGDDAAGEAVAGEAEATAAPAQRAAPPARKTTTRKATAQKATATKASVKKAAPRRAKAASATPTERGATTAAPYPMPATERPRPGAYPGAPLKDDPYRSPGRVWPD
jgi:hypothetical protein